eukprot:1318140-Amorphochlora_amoeboformis.AAC.1
MHGFKVWVPDVRGLHGTLGEILQRCKLDRPAASGGELMVLVLQMCEISVEWMSRRMRVSNFGASASLLGVEVLFVSQDTENPNFIR